MKLYVKIILSLLIFVFITSNLSCKKDIEKIKQHQQIQENQQIRSIILNFRKGNLLNNNDISILISDNLVNNQYCFEFIYPITLMYNNGNVLNINDKEDFILVLSNQTYENYIINFIYPFTIRNSENDLITVNNEEDFINIMNNCNDNK